MSGKPKNEHHPENVSAQPHFHQAAREIQRYGTVSHSLPLGLEEPVRLEMTEQLHLLLADTMTELDARVEEHVSQLPPAVQIPFRLHAIYGFSAAHSGK